MDAKLQDIRSQLVGIDMEDMTVAEHNIWRILEGTMQAAPVVCMKNTGIDDILADKDDGACPDDECSGGITDGWCSHCEDEWAWKQHENA